MWSNSLFIRLLVAAALTLSVFGKGSSRRLGVRDKIRLGAQSPFVLLYEHEAFRGKEYVQFFGKECVTLPKQYANWTSSVDTHRSCVQVCKDRECRGPCKKVFSNQGISRLSQTGFNDNIQSLRSCYF